MKPEDLLDLARGLARREAGRPRSVSLRRAASSAYYALFHTLCTLCAGSLVGEKPWRHYTPVYRSLDHKKALDGLRGAGPRLSVVARAFKSLQDKRHEADYSPEPFSLNRADTLDLIEVAAQAIDALNALTADEKLALAIKLVVKPR
ncbi:hypothetical protein [Lichenibacterium dinghuense]|uniref:hypothetical protein n=1 Tax=Lichenibacterium dinghuense TaxID=2895977 RepID=UPI001F35E012|nr:hypothetical protein [Lichenibacterium sp. 6Y81]